MLSAISSIKCVTAIFLILHITHSIVMCNECEYWAKFDLQIKINNKVSFSVKPQSRLNDNMSRYYYNRNDIGFILNISNYLDLNAYYTDKRKKSGNIWYSENLTCMDAEFKWKIQKFNFSCRNRLEYSVDNKSSVFRSRIKLKRKLHVAGYSIAPYFEEEIFYNFETKNIKENRVSLGLSKNIYKPIGLEVFYLLDSKKSTDNWNNINIFGTNLKLNFK
ncbi:MAG: DUF2490 domain-containing protein [Elusimicrobiota bacterium]